jgi:hypothetical protein
MIALECSMTTAAAPSARAVEMASIMRGFNAEAESAEAFALRHFAHDTLADLEQAIALFEGMEAQSMMVIGIDGGTGDDQFRVAVIENGVITWMSRDDAEAKYAVKEFGLLDEPREATAR